MLQNSVHRHRASMMTTVREASKTKDAAGIDVTPLDFCDKSQLLDMHGANYSTSSRAKVETAIMKDIENELTNNNVDKLAKDIFSFYICVRWVPDEVFWSVAEQELTASILQTVVDSSAHANQAIGELYQTFKFVPLLCSRNLEVYGEKDPDTKTYFRAFEKQVEKVTGLLKEAHGNQVWEGLKHVDESFCGSDAMNSKTCDAKLAVGEWVNRVSGWFGEWAKQDFDTKQDQWAVLQDIFASFKYRNASENAWNQDFGKWKNLFPYHSFVGKPDGVTTSVSPKSSERFMICYGKRVASEMHRRPAGKNIITDQNSVGCHGWWSPEHVNEMLDRVVKLWKPPTCQLAEKTYIMKKQILKMYQKMNEDLFDALPSMLQDEQMFQDGKLDEVLAGPEPFSIESLEVDGNRFYSGTRVATLADKEYDKAGCSCFVICSSCKININKFSAGTLVISNGSLKVVWDSDSDQMARPTTASEFQVVPEEYGRKSTGILDSLGSAVSQAGKGIYSFFTSAFHSQQSKLAEMLSGSLTKWVVCGVAENASYEELDLWLGTEDAAFQEHVREAYAKWTNYEKKVPGDQCDAIFDAGTPLEQCTLCEFSEMHVAHPEAYFKGDKEDDFMCPLVPPLDPAAQLAVWREKKGLCLLHMTDHLKRQYGWHYHGHFPARKQNSKQENVVRSEYLLTKLLDIKSKAGPQQISAGKFCTPEELAANPRFCAPPELAEPWPTVDDMVNHVSGWLQGAVGMPVGAMTEMISIYQRVVQQDANVSDKLKDAAVVVGEKSWDALLGLGRLAHSTAKSVSGELLYDLPHADARHARLEAELFQFNHGGDFLHSVSFQTHLGSSNTTSNSKDRYKRFAVLCPCQDFDPGMELALRWKWSELALRMVREATRQQPRIISNSTPFVEVRSEARLFFHEKQKTDNQTSFANGAAIRAEVAPGPPQAVSCEMTWSQQCLPENKCQQTGSWWSPKCEPKPQAATTESKWHKVWDLKLATEVGGQSVGEPTQSSLKALTMKFHCGKKSDFGRSGGPKGALLSFEQCVKEGVHKNGLMKAKEPWRLYHADEVVVVVELGTLQESRCKSTDQRTESIVCPSGTKKEGTLDSHLSESDKTDIVGGHYHGMMTGSGLPQGAVKEIILKPEDILAVTGGIVQ